MLPKAILFVLCHQQYAFLQVSAHGTYNAMQLMENFHEPKIATAGGIGKFGSYWIAIDLLEM